MVDVLLTAAAIAAAAPQVPAQPPAEAAPAIFMVHDQDTTVYIFGTFHALDGRSQWLSRTVKTAFDSSDELVLETLIPEDHPVPAAPRPAFSMSAGTPVGTCRSLRPPPSSPPLGSRSTPGARRACRSATAPTWSCAGPPNSPASSSKASKRSNSQLTMFNHMPRRADDARSRAPGRR